MQTTTRPAPVRPKLPGVIDTLSTGYQTLNRHLYLLLVPVLLDLIYWLGPRISVQAIARQTSTALENAAHTPGIGITTEQSAQTLAALRQTIEATGENLNLVSILSSAFSVPSLFVSQDTAVPAWLGVMPVHSVGSSGELVALAFGLFLLGIVIGAVYLGLTAQVVRDGKAQPAALAPRLFTYATRYVALLVILLLMVLFVGLPASLLVGVMALISPLLGTILVFVVWAGILWFYVHLFFTTCALFVSEADPLRAILSSITVVRISTSSAIGLLAVAMIISLGMSYVWSALGKSEVAMLTGILGNAYIGTGVTIATQVFYRDRIKIVAAAAAAAQAGTKA